MVNGKGKPCNSDNFGGSEPVGVVWALLRRKGMGGLFCKHACYMGQVEGVHAGVSLPYCLRPHIAGDGREMSLVHEMK